MKNDQVQVLYVLTKLELGGAQKVCLALKDGLEKKVVFSGLISGDEGVLVSQVKDDKSVFLIKEFKREVGIKSIISEFKSFFKMISLMRKLKKKYSKLIVHTHSTKAGIMGRWAAFFSGVKSRVHTVHGFGFHEHQSFGTWLLIYFLELVTSPITTKYVCVSKVDVDTGIKMIPGFKNKNIIIRAAVDWDSFFIPAKRIKEEIFNIEDKFVIGTVSCLKPQKNIIDLLKAFKLVVGRLPKDYRKNIILQIVGDGALRGEIESWIKENDLQDNVELLGWQSDVDKWMKSWKVFAMSSLWEGLPCAIVEARLSLLPIVAYNVGGISEVLQNRKNGFLIEPGDWKNLANKITDLILDNDLRNSMSVYSDNLHEFKSEEMVNKHLEFYERL